MLLLKIILILISFLSITSPCSSQSESEISARDFDVIIGSWQGSLTYLDYTSGKPYTMPANLNVSRTEDANKFIFTSIYPDEPNANSSDTISISPKGERIGSERVKSRAVLLNGNVEIITEDSGQDGNDKKSATFRFTYVLGKTEFGIVKEVRFDGEEDWIERHQYSYTREEAVR